MPDAGPKISHKQHLIDSANKWVVIATSSAAFVVVFCLLASQTLFGQMLYQSRIVDAKKATLKQLKDDATNASSLESSYQAFVSTPTNVLGGNSNGTGSQDGTNAKIILDALPSKYDFPALATSLEKILTSQNVTIQSITGTDDELAQANTASSGDPQPVPMQFQIAASGNYQAIQNLTKTFQSSIRPIQIQTITLSGNDSNLNVTLSAQTFYQPGKTFSIGSKTVK